MFHEQETTLMTTFPFLKKKCFQTEWNGVILPRRVQYTMERRIPIYTMIRCFTEIKVSKIIVFIYDLVYHTKAEFRKICRL